jgi:hypothetical protein
MFEDHGEEGEAEALRCLLKHWTDELQDVSVLSPFLSTQ